MATPTIIPSWSFPIKFEDFKQQFDADSGLLFNNIVELVQRSLDERDNAQAQLTAAYQRIDSLEGKLHQLNVDLQTARDGHISAKSPTNSIQLKPNSNFRSEKFPDPDKFDGTRAKLPWFISQLRMKLEVNKDRFRSESAKVVYSISRLEGRALEEALPFVTYSPSAPFSSVSAFIAHLQASYGDLVARSAARHALNTLKQGNGNFATYYSNFFRIIVILDYNEAAKIDSLLYGLCDELKSAIIHQPEKPTSLLGYAVMLMRLEDRIRSRKVEQTATR